MIINKLFIYPHPSFICTPLPSEGQGEASSYYQIIVYKMMINKLSIYPQASFYLHSPPFGGVGGGYSEGLGEASSFLMCFQPVLAPSGISYQWDIQWISVLHLLDNNAFHLFTLLREDGEVKFIMHLENHL